MSRKGKLEPSQQEEFCNVAKAQLVAQSAQQDLEHDIGGYFDKVERRAGALIEGAMTIPAAKHGIAQARYALQADDAAEPQSGQFIERSLGGD